MNQSTTHPARQPWWMLLISITAAAGLLFQGPRESAGPVIPALAIALAAAYVIPWRIAPGLLPWIARGTLFMLLILLAPENRGNIRAWYMDPALMHLFGTLILAELTIQHWLTNIGPLRLGQMITAAAGVFAAGTMTPDQRNIAILAPIYVLANFAILSAFRPTLHRSPTTTAATPPRTGRRWLLQGSALLLAMTIGFFSIDAMQTYRERLTRLGGHWLISLIQRTTAGVNPNEKLGRVFSGIESTNRTLRITGTTHAMHLRAMAFDSYSSGRWMPNLGPRPMRRISGGFAPPIESPVFRVDRLDDNHGLLYLPLHTDGFFAPAATTFDAETGHRAVMIAIDEKSDVLSYTVGMPRNEIFQGPLCRPLSPDERKDCLEIPESIDPGVREIAAKLTDPEKSRIIRKTIQYLHDNHSYKLGVEIGEGDPVNWFLLTPNSQAHCQFFAASAVMLLRLNGIPCRYVTGYYAHETDGRNSMVVRQRDAHAWAEAWLDGIGWVTVEATPPNGTPDTFEQSYPIGLIQKLRERIADLFSFIGEFFRSLQWQHIAMSGAALMLIASLLQALRSLRQRRHRPRLRAYEFPDEQYRQLAQKFEAMLRKLGGDPPASATWSEHLRDQTAQLHRSGQQTRLAAAARFVDAYNKRRFGHPDDPQALAELQTLFEEMRDV